MKLTLIRRRYLWWPTCLGWIGLASTLLLPLGWWLFGGESFLSLNRRIPQAEVLVVECWIGKEGVAAAAKEFRDHHYQYIVVAGSRIDRGWNDQGKSLAELGKQQLLKCEIEPARIIVATNPDTSRNRTFGSALSSQRELMASGIDYHSINVFTMTAHARRSRLAFSKVFGPEVKLGSIAWAPHDYPNRPWWQSTERIKFMITESLAYFAELFLNGGRV